MYYFDKKKLKKLLRKGIVVGDSFIDVIRFELDPERREITKI